MRVLDVLTSPWAIVPQKLEEMCAIYHAHARGEKADLATIEAALGKKLENPTKGYKVQDRVAILPLEGLIAKRMNIFSRISGGVSTQLFIQDLKAAADDPEADSIILLIDSPGGSVDGTQAAMQAIRDARKKKPVIAVIDGMGASAAYWIASAAEKIFIVDSTTEVGSIGVVATHTDFSKYEEKMGVKTTEITAGRYKRIASEYAPLSPEGRSSIQEQVDLIYTIFVNDVAANRGKDVETVLKDMADGRIFIGQKAIDAGLVDGIKSLPAAITMITKSNGALAPKPKGGNAMDKVIVCGIECTTQEQVDAAVKDAVDKGAKAVHASAESELAGKIAAARIEGSTNERARILAVEANAMPGHEKLLAEMKADGKTTGPEAAQRILAAEKAKTAQVAKDLAADAPPAAPASDPGQDSGQRAEDSNAIAVAAENYIAEQAKLGRKVSVAHAVRHINKGGRA